MNSVITIGNLTRDPDVRYTESGLAIARFSVALNRGKDKDGNDRGADYPSCIAFGKTAELMERYVRKGDKIAVEGHIQTGSYEKDGKKVYTTDVVADRVEFLTPKGKDKAAEDDNAAPEGFSKLEEDIPF